MAVEPIIALAEVGDRIDIPNDPELDYHALNAMLRPQGGHVTLGHDKEAARQYHLQHVNANMLYFEDFEERVRRLVSEGYYEGRLFDLYGVDFAKELTKLAYSKKFRFPTFMGAFKFYQQYALRTFDGKRYLERIEDRIVMTALNLANGDKRLARELVEEMIAGRFQPATPTFSNSGKAQRGELVSCFLLRVEDNMESIARSVHSALQLSKRGGGVAFLLSNLREQGAPIKKMKGQSAGVVPVMKQLESAFRYANQLGTRPGAGAVYLNVHHPDILRFLDTKRENADEAVRVKALSLGVVIPDITFKLLAQSDDTMYLFSPYDVERVYGLPFSDVSITEKYEELVADERIEKAKVSARKLFTTIAELQFESGYPYMVFEDTVNRANPIDGRINMSNLCSEILQVNTPSVLAEDGTYIETGRDISCNLGSLNIARAMDGGHLGKTVEIAIRGLTAVSDLSDISAVPTVAHGNRQSHAIGLGQMNLAGFLAREHIHYDSPEAVDFTSAYFAAVLFHALTASSKIAQERDETFAGFERSRYADGTFFDKYLDRSWAPKTERVVELFEKFGVEVPTVEDWTKLRRRVMKHGIYNQNLQAVPPTGSISYINNSTASIHPITDRVEIRKEGLTGRVYVPAPYMDDSNIEYYRDAFDIGPDALINVYAAATEHVDQGLSMTMFFPNSATTATVTKAMGRAWKKGIKTIYYVRLRREAAIGSEAEVCVSCSL